MNTLDPRRLEKGWYKRCLIVTVGILGRSPIMWLGLGVTAYTVSYFLSDIIGSMMWTGTVLVVANVLAHYHFNRAKMSFKSLNQKLRQLWPEFTLCAFLTSIIVLLRVQADAPTTVMPLQQCAIVLLMLGCCLSGIIYAIDSFWLLGAVMLDKGVKRIPFFGCFTTQLRTDHSLSLSQASGLSSQATERNLDNMFALGLSILFALYIPGLVVAVPIFTYCVYREAFYGPIKLKICSTATDTARGLEA
ncbi:hypothetical protein [Vibrio vulnificus]|uniref:hypothetical protein n=1 Tax=Vibrio vulnificus TaxID=672 RepID=UPI001022D187|nr:hypothetical protein [Vibrio vulnificus]RZQ33203.1 hypothetical protein D8T38_18340 [Vibrio vulnificus]